MIENIKTPNIQNESVDVIILSWNRAESTIETIKNISNQNYEFINVIIVDQGSDSDNLNKLESYISGRKNITFIKLEKNYGVAGGRNRGMKLGKGQFIVCIDNDAVFESQDAIKKTVEKFNTNKELSVIGYKVKNYFTNIVDRANWVYARQLLEKSNQEFLTTRFCGAGHAIRRKDLEITSYYDESLFFYWEELDLSYQLINLNKQIIYFPSVSVLHKIDPEQRVNWKNKRYYYLVRNALYINWKYYASFRQFVILAIGYLTKGMINTVPLQALNGVNDALKMIKKCNNETKLSIVAKVYIYQHDLKYRGSIFTRIIKEVFEKNY